MNVKIIHFKNYLLLISIKNYYKLSSLLLVYLWMCYSTWNQFIFIVCEFKSNSSIHMIKHITQWLNSLKLKPAFDSIIQPYL